ncbi:hypothetical protein CLV92_12244 [Kineococcus xinjiangensis]|uniref:Uncharacterized protein n=1 Tax=Kineococcus xinjiangensis TaxID=512762 RepID=A0A2S6ICB5_9ACTN|nr:hypothetical protein [Kineococcus xinjiangensis]PPK90868.1 hypothetical protein CLV92_12244 [Kineococcus xinjiangensis]
MTEPTRPGAAVPAPPSAVPESAVSPVADEVGTSLARLDALEALPVHEHVDVFAEVDRALRRRLTLAEG